MFQIQFILYNEFMRLHMVIFCVLILLFIFSSFPISAGPQSTTYELQEWGFGAGGEASISSDTYSLSATAGEIDSASAESATYRSNAGLIFTMQAQIPPAPTFSNPSNNYDRLKIIINTGSNPTDTEFAAQISLNSDNDWANAKYVQNDGTIGSILGTEDWMQYNSGVFNWGGASGIYISGLVSNSAYKIRIKARQGNFTETGWGPSTIASTVNPSLTYGVDSTSITFNNLNSGNSFTDSSKTTVISTSTNAYNGYVVYGHSTGPLTYLSSTIPNYGSANSNPSSWSGTGFGYSTDDNTLVGGTADRFTTGGPKYAGFTTSTPGDPVADRTGPLLAPINDQATISYRVTAGPTTPPGSYQTTVLYIVVPTY